MIILLNFLLYFTVAHAETKIAIVDTGLDIMDARFRPHLCKDGHRDFTGEGLIDTEGHGTHITGDIIRNAPINGYCLIILKYYSKKNKNSKEYLQAIKQAIDLKVNFVNYSGGGKDFISEEYEFIKNNQNVTFIVAAGNNSDNLDEIPYYPAAHTLKNVIAVGNLDEYGKIAETSNYGSLIKTWEMGQNVTSTCLFNKDCKMSGTSISTAIHTGKIIKKYVESH